MLKILLLPGAYHAPSPRYRIIQFYPLFLKAGNLVKIRFPYPDRVFRTRSIQSEFWLKMNPRFPQLVRFFTTLWILRDFWRFDIIISNRDILPDLKIRFFERAICKSKTKFIIDVDDAIYLGERREKMNEIFARASYVVAGNAVLASYISQFNKNVTIIPTVINTDEIKSLGIERPIFTIGWMGSKGPTILHLPLIFPALKELVKREGKKIRILIVSDYQPELPQEIAPFCDFKYWSVENENKLLNEMSIGLMPLPDNEFERGKCGFKAIQYMAVGIPALVSPIGANKVIVDDGINGFHCLSITSWVDKIRFLMHNENARIEMGLKGRQKVESEYSIEVAINAWSQILNGINPNK